MKDWGQARGRMESEIARKKEHLNVATNFELARGWTRSNWKTKNYKPEVETLDEFLQFSSSDDNGENSAAENQEEFESPGPKSQQIKTQGANSQRATVYTDLT